ncbi:sensor histidine kinase [Barnesiella intestinihominis]|mgnify:CR=1 FL=1|jgi:signal transduction histidine kinase|uniref:sensor histidine kinase n=2 Tax=Barnesiella intestinihominis TaxID=487174 RepID=UPI003AB491FE
MSTEKVRKSMTFDRKLFFSIGSLFIVFIAIILLFEYNLEKENRQQSLNALLQDYNELIYSQIKNKEIDQISIDSIIQSITRKPLRVTIISAHSGKVLLESQQEKEPDSLANNHLDRPEIKSSLKNGNGYAIRYSQSFKKNFFYSAKRYDDWIIRSSLPFEREKFSILSPNNEFIYFMLAISIFAILLLYYFCHSLGKSIAALSQLSQQAEQGKPIHITIKSGVDDIGNITHSLTHIYDNLLKTKEKLSIEQEKLFKHLQFSKEGLAFFSKDKRIIMANNLFIQYLNFITDNTLSPSDYLFKEANLKKINNFISQKLYEQNEQEEFISESMVIGKGSRTFLIECIIFQDHTFEIAINDITQQEQESRLKRQLTQNIAHELKTPVSSIRGYMETILSTEMDDSRKKMFMERCYAQSKRLTDLLRDISMLNRLDESKDLYDTDNTDLQKIINEVINESQAALTEREMTVETRNLHERMSINGNYSLLYSIFRNLTDNAIAYAGIGTKITIDCYLEDSKYYYFSFSDNGIGVPEEHLNRLFERFYRVDKGRSRKLGGTGLGLAIVKNAVLFHKGEIWVKNGLSGGLNILFSLRKV